MIRLKDAASAPTLEIDWSDALADGDVVTGCGWSVSPDESGGLTVTDEAFNNELTTARIAGGVEGRLYRLTAAIETQAGNRDARSIAIRIGAARAELA